MPDRLSDSRPRPKRRSPQPTSDIKALLFEMGCFGLALILFLVISLRGFIIGNDHVGGWITCGVPLAIGALTGFLLQRFQLVLIVLVAIAAIGALAGALYLGDGVGLFCAVVYCFCAMPVAAIGAALANALRNKLWPEKRGVDLRRQIIVVALFPVFLAAGETLLGPERRPETLGFSRDIDAPIDAVWRQRILDAPDLSPATGWFRVNAPRPLHGTGDATAPGDVKRIDFAKGSLTVRVDRVDRDKRVLHLTVLEQKDLETRALRLRSVTLHCEPIGDDRTRATLTIDFIPLMTPRWYWRLFERPFGSITFNAVFDAWERALTEPPPAPDNVAPER